MDEHEQHWHTFFSLFKISEARYNDWLMSEIKPEVEARLADLPNKHRMSSGRAAMRFEIFRDLLAREVLKRVELYISISTERKQERVMYSVESLSALEEQIRRSVDTVCKSLKDRDRSDASASGDGGLSPHEQRYQTLAGEAVDIALLKLHILKAEWEAMPGHQPRPPDVRLMAAKLRVSLERAFSSAGIQGTVGPSQILPPDPEAPDAASVCVSGDDLKSQRAALLAAYKKEAGNPSNRRIYTARNSGIHKPEFYAWIKGTLRPDSSTCQAFERFLREQKPPTPKKPSDS